MPIYIMRYKIMTNFKKIGITVALLTVVTIGAVTAIKNNNTENIGQTAEIGAATAGESEEFPMAEVNNERFLKTLNDAGANSATVRSMAATRTPTPTPTRTPVLQSIEAVYTGNEVVVGDQVDKQKVKVEGTFYNGTDYTYENISDFTITNSTIHRVGDNEIVIYYKGKRTTVTVTGKEPLEIVSITAYYIGDPVIVTNKINRKDVEVYAQYNWPEKADDKITGFTMTPGTIEAVGENKVIISYGKLEPVVIYVEGLEKEITNVEMKYIGDVVYVGTYVNKDDFEVLVTYNDGSQSNVETFTLTGQLINNEGINYVNVVYKGYIETLEVQAIAKPASKWKNVPRGSGSGDASTIVTLLVSRDKRAQTISIGYVPWEEIDACVNRVFYTNNYLGFEITYTDPDAIFEFPIPCRVKRPEEFNAENFSIFYSPNKKTIMARVNGEYLDADKEYYVFDMEEPGTYIMVDMDEGKLVSSINVVSTDIKLRVNRNYSIDPVVLPNTAGNREVSYYSTDEWVATVSERGKIKAIAPGECDIYIQALDDSGVYEVIHVTVTEK
jgi:hypothetical protein